MFFMYFAGKVYLLKKVIPNRWGSYRAEEGADRQEDKQGCQKKVNPKLGHTTMKSYLFFIL